MGVGKSTRVSGVLCDMSWMQSFVRALILSSRLNVRCVDLTKTSRDTPHVPTRVSGLVSPVLSDLFLQRSWVTEVFGEVMRQLCDSACC